MTCFCLIKPIYGIFCSSVHSKASNTISLASNIILDRPEHVEPPHDYGKYFVDKRIESCLTNKNICLRWPAIVILFFHHFKAFYQVQEADKAFTYNMPYHWIERRCSALFGSLQRASKGWAYL